jgi:hypothetical protein
MHQLLAHCVSAFALARAGRQVFFVVGKNYRLQDIQLSKMLRSFRADSIGLPALVERRLRDELLSILRRLLRGRRCFCDLLPRRAGKPESLQTRASWGFQRPQRAQTPKAFTKPNKVENTGLEPVTSWLQTRRSPS